MKSWFIKHKFILAWIGIFTLIIAAIVGFTTWVVLTDKDSEQTGDPYLSENEYAVLDLGSKNCNPCDRLQVVMEDLRNEYGDKIDFKTFDIVYTTEGSEVANHYKVNIMPTLLFLNKDGREIKRVIGYHSQEQIKEILQELGWL